jgi:hypothetical protein
MRGSTAVAEGWKRLYEGKEAPFSWEPERVEVNDSGTLGLSTGPVRDSAGKRIGTYNSIWRRGADGRWTIIFDNGCPPCDCAAPSPAAPGAAPVSRAAGRSTAGFLTAPGGVPSNRIPLSLAIMRPLLDRASD